MVKKSLSQMTRRSFLVVALAFAFNSCITSNYSESTPKEVRDIRSKVEDIVDRSFLDSVTEQKLFTNGCERDIEESVGNKIDSGNYGLHFEDYSWPRTDIPGIDSLGFHTDQYNADVLIIDEKVFLRVTLPTIVVKNNKTYMFNEYKAEVNLKNR